MCNKTMSYSSTNIHFDYDGHYSKSEDVFEWIPSDGCLYAISFKTSSLEEKHLFVVEGEDMHEDDHRSMYEEAEYELHSIGSGT
uniref:Uncharacterized protein n=1 Tax=Brassica oleracea var. oleracea TaxID=109376 RepID=A0A0D3CHR8_BRAOL